MAQKRDSGIFRFTVEGCREVCATPDRGSHQQQPGTGRCALLFTVHIPRSQNGMKCNFARLVGAVHREACCCERSEQ